MSHSKKEYKVITIGGTNLDRETALNEIAGEGWHVRHIESGMVYLERDKAEEGPLTPATKIDFPKERETPKERKKS